MRSISHFLPPSPPWAVFFSPLCVGEVTECRKSHPYAITQTEGHLTYGIQKMFMLTHAVRVDQI